MKDGGEGEMQAKLDMKNYEEVISRVRIMDSWSPTSI